MALRRFLDRRILRGQYRYPGLPEACYCPNCGYEITAPSKHCPELGPCPQCGAARLWRKK